MILRIYPYIGPAEIQNRTVSSPKGAVIQSFTDLVSWVRNALSDIKGEAIVATFVANLDGYLCLADRRSEHVACAKGQSVLGAGEISFVDENGVLTVNAISNQSTGYCPDVDSWSAVEASLDLLRVTHPGRFTTEIVFRRCPSCRQTNIVKDGWFACDLCGGELPQQWNFS